MKEPEIPTTATLARGPMGNLVAQIIEPVDRKQQLLALLQSDPAAANRAALTISGVALELLPVGTLSTVEKAAYGRYKPTTALTLCEHVCDALTMLQPLGLQLGVDPARLSALPQRRSVYTSFRLFGAQITNLAMDRRAVLAPMQSVLLEQGLTHVNARFKDPTLTREQRDKLLDDFGPALVELDRVLNTPAERKEEIKDAKKSLQEELAEAQANAAYAETQLKLRQKLLVPREELIAAARLHQERKAKGQEAPKPDAPYNPKGPRRLL